MKQLLTIICLFITTALFAQSSYKGQGLTRSYATDTIVGFKTANTDGDGQAGFTAVVGSDTTWLKTDSTGQALIEATQGKVTVPDTVNFAGGEIWSASANGDTIEMGGLQMDGPFLTSEMSGMDLYFSSAAAGDGSVSAGMMNVATGQFALSTFDTYKAQIMGTGTSSDSTSFGDFGDTLRLLHISPSYSSALTMWPYKQILNTEATGGFPHSNIEVTADHFYWRRSDGDDEDRSALQLQGDSVIFIAQDNPDSLTWVWQLDGLHFKNEADEVASIDSAGVFTQREALATPSNPDNGAEARIYMKDDKFIIQYNDGGTVRYKYLDLTGTGVTWVHTTSAP